MSSTTAVMLQDRLNDIERNICDGIDFRQELNEAYALADELEAENAKLLELAKELFKLADRGLMELGDDDFRRIVDEAEKLGIEMDA